LMLAINLQAFQEVFAWGSQQLKHQQLTAKNTTKSIMNNAQPKPSLICMASIAGMMDYPYASLYAKSKRAMIATASAYRLALAPYNIQVTCIASGYIDTKALRDLNQGSADHKPFIISIDKALQLIMKAIDEGVELAVFPKRLYYLTYMLNKLPKPLLSRVLRGKLDK
ncbi:MAG: SDR family NAD(P)-dependent oxidoreductase, partial [Psychrobacter sp.]